MEGRSKSKQTEFAAKTQFYQLTNSGLYCLHSVKNKATKVITSESLLEFLIVEYFTFLIFGTICEYLDAVSCQNHRD